MDVWLRQDQVRGQTLEGEIRMGHANGHADVDALPPGTTSFTSQRIYHTLGSVG